jgi:hypothetical protein
VSLVSCTGHIVVVCFVLVTVIFVQCLTCLFLPNDSSGLFRFLTHFTLLLFQSRTALCIVNYSTVQCNPLCWLGCRSLLVHQGSWFGVSEWHFWSARSVLQRTHTAGRYTHPPLLHIHTCIRKQIWKPALCACSVNDVTSPAAGIACVTGVYFVGCYRKVTLKLKLAMSGWKVMVW